MSNQLINIRLSALNEVGKVSLKRPNGDMVECIAIPIEKNCISKSQNGDYYLNLIAWGSDKLKDNKTHLIKLSIPENVRSLMTQEEINGLPILGDVKPLVPKAKEIETYTAVVEAEPAKEESDDLPFDM